MVFFKEMDALWAETLMEILKKQGISVLTQPVHGAAFTMKTGWPERVRLFVSKEDVKQAENWYSALFSENASKEALKEVLKEEE